MHFPREPWYYFMVSLIRWRMGQVERGCDSWIVGARQIAPVRHGSTELDCATPHSSSTGPEAPISSSANSSVAVRVTDTVASFTYFLPTDLDAAIRQHLDDQQLDRLSQLSLEELARSKKTSWPRTGIETNMRPFFLLCRNDLNASSGRFKAVHACADCATVSAYSHRAAAGVASLKRRP